MSFSVGGGTASCFTAAQCFACSEEVLAAPSLFVASRARIALHSLCSSVCASWSPRPVKCALRNQQNIIGNGGASQNCERAGGRIRISESTFYFLEAARTSTSGNGKWLSKRYERVLRNDWPSGASRHCCQTSPAPFHVAPTPHVTVSHSGSALWITIDTRQR